MSLTTHRQQLERRIQVILRGGYFSTKHGDTVITIYTDKHCSHVVKNRFSTRMKHIFTEPDYDFIVHLYNYDSDLLFKRDGELVRTVRFPDHHCYAEKCDCQSYTFECEPIKLVKCYDSNCGHNLTCPRRRQRVADETVLKVEAELQRIDDEGTPEGYSNNQAFGHRN